MAFVPLAEDEAGTQSQAARPRFPNPEMVNDQTHHVEFEGFPPRPSALSEHVTLQLKDVQRVP